jgi:hypothetical protein
MVVALVRLLAEKGVEMSLRASGLAEVPEMQEAGNVLQRLVLRKELSSIELGYKVKNGRAVSIFG